MITYKQTLGLDKNPEAKRIRQTVFVEEQGFQNEFDEIDPIARHVVAWEDGRPVATGRVFPKDGSKEIWTIGRVAVLPPYRGKGIGALIVRQLEQIARECGAREWMLS
ncbi:GNAT family N-acetyltransferase, partial [Blautia wexlerae]|nr:GNAT family N-acetyltransferase [Blautia wexlerae]